MSRRIDTTRLKLELERARLPLLAFAFLVVCGLISSVIILRNLTFQRPTDSYFSVEAAFDSVKGVTPGQQQVRIAGVPVGVIKGVELVDNRPVLTLAIRSRYGPIYRDARMRLRPQTPLQDMYVEIESRGTKRAGVLEGDHVLPTSRTVTPVDISRVMNTFDEPTRERLGALLDGLGAGLTDRGQSLRWAFAELAPFLDVTRRVSAALADRRVEMRRLVVTLGRVTEAVGVRDEQLASLVRTGHVTLAALAAERGPLAGALEELPPTLEAVRASFAQVRAMEARLDPAVASFEPVARELQSGLDALERFGRDATPALTALRGPISRLRPLAEELAPTSRSLAAALERLSPQTPRFDSITGRVERCLGPLQGFLQQSLSFNKFYDAWGVLPRAESTFGADTSGGATSAEPAPGYRVQPNCAGEIPPLLRTKAGR